MAGNPRTPSNSVDAMIDNAIKTSEGQGAPEVVKPEAVQPEVIPPNDADGRQPGDANAPIELPPEVTAPPVAVQPAFIGDAAGSMSADELAATLSRPGFPQSPNPVGTPAPAAPEQVAKAFGVEKVVEAPRVISAQTLAEMEAGREAVARRAAEYTRNREITAREQARKLDQKAEASPDDLSYHPRG